MKTLMQERLLKNKYILSSLLIHTGLLMAPLFSIEKLPEKIEIELLPPPVQTERRKALRSKGDSAVKKLDTGALFKLSGSGSKGLGKVGKDSIRGSDGPSFDPLHDPKFVYTSYFDRIHDKILTIWIHKAQDQVVEYYKKTKHNMPFKSTKVWVTLDANGTVVDVKVIALADVPGLNTIALEAFKEAGQFEHPPKELVVNGQITFDWEFIIDT